MLLLAPRRSVAAENLFLRRQLALYLERGAKPRRVDAATRVSLALLSRLFDWRDALVVVRPETLIRWHRAGWRLFWRIKSRPGRPPIPLELRQLIRRMASENPLWGEERIANELLLKLGLRVSPRTVRKYMPKRPPGRPRGDQRWSTFLRNHASAIVACDFFVAVTATFRLLYVFVVIEHGSRRVLRVAVDGAPDRGMDPTAVAGGRWIRPCPPVSDSRPGQHLREKPGRIDQESRPDRAQVAAAQPEGQCDLRTGDRNDSTRVPGLVDTAVGVASAIDPEGMGGSLQPRSPAHGARSRRAGPSIGGRAVRDNTNPPSARRAPQRARPIGAGRLASRISAGARVGVIE